MQKLAPSLASVIGRVTNMTTSCDLPKCAKCSSDEVEHRVSIEPVKWLCGPCHAAVQQEQQILAIQRQPEKALAACGVPRRYWPCRFDNYVATQPDMVDTLAAITPEFTDSVFLSSAKSGTGKTHLAVSTLYSLLLKSTTSARFVSSPFLFLDIKNSYDGGGDKEWDVINKYCNYGFLVVDDIGVEKCSDWAMQVWYMIIDRRYSELRPTIYTSNLSIGDVAASLGTRIASRLSSGLCYTIAGEDYRRKQKGVAS